MITRKLNHTALVIAMSDLRFILSSLLFYSVLLMVSSSSSGVAGAAFPIAKPGCNDTCGNVKIPYPFGIGPGCALNESYTLICSGSAIRSTAPYIRINPYTQYIEVLEVSLSDQTVTLNIEKDLACANQGSKNFNYISRIDLTGTPFFFSKQFNKLMLLGCANALLNQIDGRQVQSGCTSMCDTNLSSTISNCYGINCCETSIPFDLSRYWVNFTIPSVNVSYPCVSGFLVDQRWKPEDYSNDKLPILFPYVPVVLSWTLTNRSDIDLISGCSVTSSILELQSGNITNYQCECRIFGGLTWLYANPYLDGACDYATSLLNSGKKNTKVVIIVGVSVGVGVLFLMVVIFILYKVVRKRRNKRRKQKFFERNGGLLLERQLSAEEGVIDRTLVFTDKELIRATDGFNQNRILGQGGQGTVYKGMLSDGRIVAIKKSKKVDESQLEPFINEVVILSQVNHRNVVKLLGCCLETEVPLLVYEFIPNGTLHRLIHNGNVDDIPFTWNLRLRIATEIAGALAYLHSAISIPIFHRDIKSSNILLDEKYIAKVSDFGTSMSVATDKTHFTTLVKGTFGYLDPEYFQSSQFTEKSDVYSFGVVLVELLTRQKPISATGTGEDSNNLSLATRFLRSMDQDSLPTILDSQIRDQRNEEEVFAVAKLAQQCLNLNGKKRPTMKEVAIKLENIKLSSTDSTNRPKFQSNFSFGQENIVISGKGISITTSTLTTGSESISLDLDAYPLLHSSD